MVVVGAIDSVFVPAADHGVCLRDKVCSGHCHWSPVGGPDVKSVPEIRTLATENRASCQIIWYIHGVGDCKSKTARAMGTRAVPTGEGIGMDIIRKRRRETLGNILLVVLLVAGAVAYGIDLGNRTEQRLAARAAR